MAIVLPNFGEQLGKDIASLGEGLAHIIDPMMDFHTKFRSAIAENPEILQKLTDYAYLNKGDLGPAGKYIPKDVRESVVKATPSIDAREHKGLSDAFDSIDPGTRELFLKARAMHTDPLTMTIDPIKIASAKKALEDHPNLKEFIGYETLTGKGPGAVSEDQMVAEMGPAAREFWANLSPEERRDVAASKYNLLGDIHFQERLQAQRDRKQDRVDHIQESEANSRYNKTGVGSPELWKRYLYDPKIKARLDKLKTGGQGVIMTDDDQDYLQIDRARKEMGADFERLHNKASTMNIRDAYDHIIGNDKKGYEKDDELKRAIDLQTLNGELNYRGLPIQAMYGKSLMSFEERVEKGGQSVARAALGNITKLRFVNPKTKEEVDPELVIQKLEADDRLTGSHQSLGGPPKPATEPPSNEGHNISLADMKPDERRMATGILSQARTRLASPNADTLAIKKQIVDKLTPQMSAYILKQLGLQ